jgi:hypothetical protein
MKGSHHQPDSQRALSAQRMMLSAMALSCKSCDAARAVSNAARQLSNASEMAEQVASSCHLAKFRSKTT